MAPHARQTIFVYDVFKARWAPFYQHLAQVGTVVSIDSLDEFFQAMEDNPESPVMMADVRCLREAPQIQVRDLLAMREHCPIGLTTDEELSAYLEDLATWELSQVCVKAPSPTVQQIGHHISCLRNPSNGFGLQNYMGGTCVLMRRVIRTVRDKQLAIEDVINQFATSGFEIHELYDVRLVLEEAVNNSIFHAYKNPDGTEKYRIGRFDSLNDGEEVTLVYGSTSCTAGFSVSDRGGTLRPQTILGKLRRQMSEEGVLDENGRGLYLSRLLSSRLVVNIEHDQRTELIALFDEERRSRVAKPFLVNYVGSRQCVESTLDPELD